MKIILASSSPRRKEILGKLGLSLGGQTVDTDEIRNKKLSLHKQIQEIAEKKAAAIYKINIKNNNFVIISADTMVIYKKQFLGKPLTKENAIKTLSKLSGNKHNVITSICFIFKIKNKIKKIIKSDIAVVEFDKLSKKDIIEYVNTNEPLDKAGAYGIQGIAAKFIKKINGNYETVMGLSSNVVWNTLKEEKII